MVQNRIGAHCPAFDLAAACSGFLFALETAAGFLSRGAYNRVLVVSAERMSGIIDWTDRGTCCIFGDGAGAALGKGADCLVASHLMTKGGDDVITIPTRYDRSPWYSKNEISEITSVHMNGRETYKFAVMAMSDNIKDLDGFGGRCGRRRGACHSASGKLPHYQRSATQNPRHCAGEVLHQHRPLRQHVFRECADPLG